MLLNHGYLRDAIKTKNNAYLENDTVKKIVNTKWYGIEKINFNTVSNIFWVDHKKCIDGTWFLTFFNNYNLRQINLMREMLLEKILKIGQTNYIDIR